MTGREAGINFEGESAEAPPIPEETLERVRAVDGVELATGVVQDDQTKLLKSDGEAIDTGGAPALALGMDPTDAGVMHAPPRPRSEGVMTRSMWAGILYVGVIMAAGTLLVLDASLPGGLLEGAGTMRYAQTMAFTTLTMFQIFNILNARSDTQSAFVGLFSNKWLWGAVVLALVLQASVVYVPFLQQAFATVSLRFGDWLLRAVAA